MQGMLCAGAIRSTVRYSEREPWSFSTVVSLCGVHAAIPIGDATSTLHSQQLIAALPVAVDVRGQWRGELEASQWALQNVYHHCSNTSSLIAMQVHSMCSSTSLYSPRKQTANRACNAGQGWAAASVPAAVLAVTFTLQQWVQAAFACN